jgi:hypothetical protein
MCITCREQDRKVFEGLGFGVSLDDINETTELVPGIVHMVESSSDGHYDEITKGLHVPFLSHHESTYEYEAVIWASDGETTLMHESNHNGEPTIEVDKDGNPVPVMLEHAREYRALENKVKALFGLKED